MKHTVKDKKGQLWATDDFTHYFAYYGPPNENTTQAEFEDGFNATKQEFDQAFQNIPRLACGLTPKGQKLYQMYEERFGQTLPEHNKEKSGQNPKHTVNEEHHNQKGDT